MHGTFKIAKSIFYGKIAPENTTLEKTFYKIDKYENYDGLNKKKKSKMLN